MRTPEQNLHLWVGWIEFLYRYLIDDFVVGYSKELAIDAFVLKDEEYSSKKGKRQYVCDKKTREFMKKLDDFFQSRV